MKIIAHILMERDGLSWDEAVSEYLDVRSLILQAIQSGHFDDAENILQDELGLEPDYIWEFI